MSVLIRFDMSRWSISVEPNAANAGANVPTRDASLAVLLVNGGFMITRSNSPSGMSATTCVAVSSPTLPVRSAGSLMLNRVIVDDDWSSSNEPMATLPSSCLTVGERVQPCLAEPDVGLCAGQRRAGDVDGRRHHVAAVQHLFHHDGVKRGEVAP